MSYGTTKLKEAKMIVMTAPSKISLLKVQRRFLKRVRGPSLNLLEILVKRGNRGGEKAYAKIRSRILVFLKVSIR